MFRKVANHDSGYAEIFFTAKYAKMKPNDGIGTFWDVSIIILLFIVFSMKKCIRISPLALIRQEKQ